MPTMSTPLVFSVRRSLGIEIPTTSEGNSIYSVMGLLGIPYFERWHADWMTEVQKLQDTGIPWALVVKYADRSFKPRDPADSQMG